MTGPLPARTESEGQDPDCGPGYRGHFGYTQFAVGRRGITVFYLPHKIGPDPNRPASVKQAMAGRTVSWWAVAAILAVVLGLLWLIP